MTNYKTVPKLIDLGVAKLSTTPRLCSIYIPSKRYGDCTVESPLQKYVKNIRRATDNRLSEVRDSGQTEQKE